MLLGLLGQTLIGVADGEPPWVRWRSWSGRGRVHRGTSSAGGYRGRCVRSAEYHDANLLRRVRPERATNIVLSALVDVSDAPNTATQTHLGVADRSALRPKQQGPSKSRARLALRAF